MADLATTPTRMAVRDAAKIHPPQRRVLVLGIGRPENAALMEAARREIASSRHDVTFRIADGTQGRGKWANLNALLEQTPADGFDWLILLDDDVELPRRFLDVFLFCAERHDLVLAQPAHRFDSHAAWRVTRRRPDIVRRTWFVEIGPLTALRRQTFDTLLPFPDLAMGWGLDAHWAAIARDNGWPAGIVDLVPIRHAHPVASTYDREAILAEARTFLADRPYIKADEARRTLAIHRDWR